MARDWLQDFCLGGGRSALSSRRKALELVLGRSTKAGAMGGVEGVADEQL